MYIYIWVTCKFQKDTVKEEQKNDEHLWTIEKVINPEIFAPVYEPPDEIFNRRKYMLTKKNEKHFEFKSPCSKHDFDDY